MFILFAQLPLFTSQTGKQKVQAATSVCAVEIETRLEKSRMVCTWARRICTSPFSSKCTSSSGQNKAFDFKGIILVMTSPFYICDHDIL